MANFTTEIFDQQQPQIVYGILGDTYIYANEREVEVEEYSMEMGENAVPTKVTKYEYDVRHFPLTDKTESGVLAALKQQIIGEIEEFDSGQYAQYGDMAVNDFTMGGMHMWLDKDTRNGLRFRFESQKAIGETETTLWYGVTPISLNIDAAISMLHYLEVYASACFDCTANHKKNVLSLETIDEICSYDYTVDYPEHLSFAVE